MDRKGRYVKRADRLSVPGVVFAIALRPAHDSQRAGSNLDTTRWYGAEASVSYRRRGKWSAPATAVFTSADSMREWMGERAIAGRLNWVIADSATDVLTLSSWWAYAEQRGIDFADRRRDHKRKRVPARDGERISVAQFVVSGPPDIITYTDRAVSWRWVSASNYWPDGPPVARTAGGDRGVDARGAVTDGRYIGTVGETPSVALLTRFRRLCDWWGRVATAPLGCTAGQCAWGVLRSHVGERQLCTHSCADVHRLERMSAHGGRASVWYCREIRRANERYDVGAMLGGGEEGGIDRGPIGHVDVSSMYPSLLARERFPVKLGPCYVGIPPAALVSLCRDFGVIARVRVRVSRGEYPYRTPTGTVYPVGTFTATLAGPDLLALSRDGEILRTYDVATYTLGNPFAGALAVLLDARAEAKRQRDRDTEALSKLVANSLAGRFAKREGGWSRRSKLDGVYKWGESYEIGGDGVGLSRYRWIAGAAWEYRESLLPRGPHTAVFSYLTAYGRQHMRAIRDALPARSVVAQDTDGLYLLPAGIRALIHAGISERTGPGALRVTGSADSGIWYGPRHYRWGRKWVLAGLPYESVDEVRRTVTYSSRTPLFSERHSEAPTCVHRVRRTVAIPSDLERGRVGADGWILPPHIITGRAME